MVRIDVEQIQTVLKNILVNALKYSVLGNDPVQVRLSEDAKGCIIEIKDQGQGIPEDELELIFEPFIVLTNPVQSLQEVMDWD